MSNGRYNKRAASTLRKSNNGAESNVRYPVVIRGSVEVEPRDPYRMQDWVIDDVSDIKPAFVIMKESMKKLREKESITTKGFGIPIAKRDNGTTLLDIIALAQRLGCQEPETTDMNEDGDFVHNNVEYRRIPIRTQPNWDAVRFSYSVEPGRAMICFRPWTSYNDDRFTRVEEQEGWAWDKGIYLAYSLEQYQGEWTLKAHWSSSGTNLTEIQRNALMEWLDDITNVFNNVK